MSAELAEALQRVEDARQAYRQAQDLEARRVACADMETWAERAADLLDGTGMAA
jgi:hypothetical protein